MYVMHGADYEMNLPLDEDENVEKQPDGEEKGTIYFACQGSTTIYEIYRGAGATDRGYRQLQDLSTYNTDAQTAGLGQQPVYS